MLLLFIIVILLQYTYASDMVHWKNKYLAYETNIKKDIEGFCRGKSEDFCSVKHLEMLYKLIEEKERKMRMKQMKDNIIQEIVNSIRGINRKQAKNNIVKGIIKDIQEYKNEKFQLEM